MGGAWLNEERGTVLLVERGGDSPSHWTELLALNDPGVKDYRPDRAGFLFSQVSYLMT